MPPKGEMTVRIRQDIVDRFATHDPVLLEGELVLVNDKQSVVIGNGADPFSELELIPIDPRLAEVLERGFTMIQVL
jgi:hypothetical protein